MKLSVVGAFFLAALRPVLAQSAPGTVPLDPTATCPQETADQIVNCLAVIENDEATRPGGPCSSSDWACICNKQQGLIACWAPCYGAQPLDQINYNNNNCNGQHGVTNAAANGGSGVQYQGSPITTTAAVSGTTGGVPTTIAASTTSSIPSSATSAPASSGTSVTTGAPSPTTSATSGSSNSRSNGAARASGGSGAPAAVLLAAGGVAAAALLLA